MLNVLVDVMEKVQASQTSKRLVLAYVRQANGVILQGQRQKAVHAQMNAAQENMVHKHLKPVKRRVPDCVQQVNWEMLQEQAMKALRVHMYMRFSPTAPFHRDVLGETHVWQAGKHQHV